MQSTALPSLGALTDEERCSLREAQHLASLPGTSSSCTKLTAISATPRTVAIALPMYCWTLWSNRLDGPTRPCGPIRSMVLTTGDAGTAERPIRLARP
jgi:hypothetical protein